MLQKRKGNLLELFIYGQVWLILLTWPVRISRALILNENFDTREFSIFIANKRWVRNILRPLLELCAKEDRYKWSALLESTTSTVAAP